MTLDTHSFVNLLLGRLPNRFDDAIYVVLGNQLEIRRVLVLRLAMRPLLKTSPVLCTLMLVRLPLP